jgi:hypothetical protein
VWVLMYMRAATWLFRPSATGQATACSVPVKAVPARCWPVGQGTPPASCYLRQAGCERARPQVRDLPGAAPVGREDRRRDRRGSAEPRQGHPALQRFGLRPAHFRTARNARELRAAYRTAADVPCCLDVAAARLDDGKELRAIAAWEYAPRDGRAVAQSEHPWPRGQPPCGQVHTAAYQHQRRASRENLQPRSSSRSTSASDHLQHDPCATGPCRETLGAPHDDGWC